MTSSPPGDGLPSVEVGPAISPSDVEGVRDFYVDSTVQPFRYEDKVYSITISLGVATTVGDSSMTPAGLIRLADEKLYQAKHDGRNLVRS